MVDPMTDFVGHGKSLPLWSLPIVDRDDGLVLIPANPGLAGFQRAILYLGSETPGNRFQVNVFRPVDAKRLQEPLRSGIAH